MRRTQKARLLEILQTLREAHKAVKKYISGGEPETARALLAECQQSAIQIGGLIEQSEGEDCAAVRMLEDYCEELYQISEGAPGKISPQKAAKRLHNALARVAGSIEADIAVQIEVVFLPYKASMWDSLESVWRAAEADPNCDAYVIPIPYYDKNPDGSLGMCHYEGALYPKDVPVVQYQSYDFEKHRPDVVFIHNGYDDCNFVTSVHPDYYSCNLKKFTELLIYIPYFISTDSVSEAMCTVPGCWNADRVFVQSEKIRREYIRRFQNLGFPEDGPVGAGGLREKFVALGSPKFDKAICDRPENYDLPEEWRALITGPGGSKQKVVLYNTSLSALLQEDERYLEKLRHVLSRFQKLNQAVLWWRPHPLSVSTYQSMRPHLLPEYEKIVRDYRKGGWGIFDDTADVNRAVAYADCYYGDAGSALQASFLVTGKPILLQRFDPIDDSAVVPHILGANGTSLFLSPVNSAAVMRVDLVTHEMRVIRPGRSSGKWQYAWSAEVDGVVYFSPCSAKEILTYDTGNGRCGTIPYKLDTEQLLKWNPRYLSDWNFAANCVWGGKVFFPGNTYPAIMSLDPSSGSLTYYMDWPAAFHNGTDSTMSNGFCQIDASIVLIGASSTILIFDMETGAFSTEKVPHPSAEEGFSGIAYGDGCLWLIPKAKTSILKFDLGTKSIAEYDHFPSVFADTGPAQWYVVFANHSLWLFPINSNAVLRLYGSGELSVVRTLPSWRESAYSGVCLSGDHIYAVRRCCPEITVYDVETGEYRDFLPHAKGIEEESSSDYRPGSIQEAAMWENGVDTVETMLRTTIRDSEKLIADWIASPDGKAGERIYRYVKDLILSEDV